MSIKSPLKEDQHYSCPKTTPPFVINSKEVNGIRRPLDTARRPNPHPLKLVTSLLGHQSQHYSNLLVTAHLLRSDIISCNNSKSNNQVATFLSHFEMICPLEPPPNYTSDHPTKSLIRRPDSKVPTVHYSRIRLGHQLNQPYESQ